MFESLTIRTTERHRAAGTEVAIEREITLDFPLVERPLPPADAQFEPTPRPDVIPAPPMPERPRFERQVDGTVLDRELGLYWSPTWKGEDCAAERVNHHLAAKAAESFGEGWRLPTRRELISLVDDTRHEPAIDVEAFPDTQSAAYWTSTPAAWSPSSVAWIVSFGYGSAGTYSRDADAFVRAVRSVPVAPVPGQ